MLHMLQGRMCSSINHLICEVMDGNRENRHLVSNKPVEFEKYPVQIQDFKKIIDRVSPKTSPDTSCQG